MQQRPVTEIVAELQSALNHSSSDAIKVRIEAKIKGLKADFDEELEHYSVDGNTMSDFGLEEYEDFEKYGYSVGNHIYQQIDEYSLETYDCVEAVVKEINEIEKEYLFTRNKIGQLEELLKGDN